MKEKEREREREREREKKASNGVLIHTLEDKMTLVEWLSRRLFWHKNTCTKEQNMTRWVGHMAFDHTQRTKFLPMHNQQAHLPNGSSLSIPHFCNSLKNALTLAVNLVCSQFPFFPCTHHLPPVHTHVGFRIRRSNSTSSCCCSGGSAWICQLRRP